MAISPLFITDARPVLISCVNIQTRRTRTATALSNARPSREMTGPRVTGLPSLDLGPAAVFMTCPHIFIGQDVLIGTNTP